MVTVWVDKTINRIKLQTDDPSLKFLLEVTYWDTRYLPWKKKYGPVQVRNKIYDEKRVTSVRGLYTFTLGIGWAAYLARTLTNYISQEDYNLLVNLIMAPTYRDVPFPELRDYQNEDVLHLLKYKIGLYGVYTGYGDCNLLYIESLIRLPTCSVMIR